MILTEGVDIPNVKTVFLTRPVQSEILLRQMVGRALRGPAAGGTKEAYLVSFQDRWREFEEWERPLEHLKDIIDIPIEDIVNDDEDPNKIFEDRAIHARRDQNIFGDRIQQSEPNALQGR